MPKTFKCILFDLDGTLLSTGGAGIRALDRAFFELYGVLQAMENIEASGKTDPSIIREIFRAKLNRDCDGREMAETQERYLEFLDEECAAAKDYEVVRGVPELLDKLKTHGFMMGLGTGNLERGARKKLHRSGLNHYFPFGGFGSDSEKRTEILLKGYARACRESGAEIARKHVFIVGDTARDIWAAKEAGFPVIAVATGSSPLQVLQEQDPDYYLQNFEDQDDFLNIVLDGGTK